MLIHPWDAATGPAEWQDWLATTGRFGILAVNNLDPARAPLVLPLHFTGGPDEDGVPTSYYAAVQFVCRPAVVDDPQGKAEILTAQLADFQPEGGHAAVAPGTAPYGRMLPGIRGVRLTVLRVDAKFKYDDANPVGHRATRHRPPPAPPRCRRGA